VYSSRDTRYQYQRLARAPAVASRLQCAKQLQRIRGRHGEPPRITYPSSSVVGRLDQDELNASPAATLDAALLSPLDGDYLSSCPNAAENSQIIRLKADVLLLLRFAMPMKSNLMVSTDSNPERLHTHSAFS